MKNLGIVLIVVGIVLMLFTGFTYITKKKVVDIGPVEVNKEEQHPVQWSPVAGGILLVAGIVLVVNGKRTS
ncbi:MAG: hypothetical protein ACJ77K_09195 [Bacteroidia bacterium]|jgi:hypothetical protein